MDYYVTSKHIYVGRGCEVERAMNNFCSRGNSANI